MKRKNRSRRPWFRSFVSHCCPNTCWLKAVTVHVSAPAMYEPSALLSRQSAMEQLRITSGAWS
eukprot:CAMPEP_0202904090 /NCGR_PEP_ID=MMETSP1392-20130828/27847_1 /ASSEMBLY_ACC=CAM_ASM_000868 /TAXON_ID=225041 /ORGANISM="Chlamydomonas chlamydogama, Strain SAG 11-48b" /LENGTH=62 /DNA_ID=CAMNT_0049591571 /DNA_START=898 /DNA_END=1086 /DNA_ORIENTATION=+